MAAPLPNTPGASGVATPVRRAGPLWLLPPVAVLALGLLGASVWEPRAFQDGGQPGAGTASDAVVAIGRGHLGSGDVGARSQVAPADGDHGHHPGSGDAVDG